MWNDPDLNIQWNVSDPLVSEKDNGYTPFNEFNSPF